MKGLVFGIVAAMIATAALAQEDPAIAKAKAAISARLKDPDSARFTDVSINGNVVCGRVNAKNAFGGYVGGQPFRYFMQDGTAVIVDRAGISTVFLDTMSQPGTFCP